MLARDGADGVEVAGDLPGERLFAVGGGADQLARALPGLVVRAPDLGADHGPLALDLVLLQCRMQDAVGQHIHRQRQPVVGHAVPVGGQLARGVRVERAAGALDRGGDRRGLGPALGALEQHVLEVVRQPQRGARLVAAADADVGGQRRGLRVRHGRHGHAQPVREGGDVSLRSGGRVR